MAYPLTHYIDVVIRPDPEFPIHQVLNALYAKLHRALHDLYPNGISQIVVSFPKQKSPDSLLGDTLRLHGSEAQLLSLMVLPWRNGMHDHLQCNPIAEVPIACAQYRAVRRVNMQGNPEKLRRRWLKRLHLQSPEASRSGDSHETQQRRLEIRRLLQQGAHEEAARIAYPDSMAQRSRLPFLVLQSRSNGQRYTLFIRQDIEQLTQASTKFNTFGLSVEESVVPWF